MQQRMKGASIAVYALAAVALLLTASGPAGASGINGGPGGDQTDMLAVAPVVKGTLVYTGSTFYEAGGYGYPVVTTLRFSGTCGNTTDVVITRQNLVATGDTVVTSADDLVGRIFPAPQECVADPDLENPTIVVNSVSNFRMYNNGDWSADINALNLIPKPGK
jgi:hypothetical protein